MGLFFSKLYQLFEEWGNTPARILMLGLDAAGKYCFKFEFFVVFFSSKCGFNFTVGSPHYLVILTSYINYHFINPYKPGVNFVRHRQIMQTQIGRRIMWRLIRVSTVCLQNVLFKFD